MESHWCYVTLFYFIYNFSGQIALLQIEFLRTVLSQGWFTKSNFKLLFMFSY